MKRSEMVKLMENAWREYTSTLNPENAGVKNAMSYVLFAMEEENILPPGYPLVQNFEEEFNDGKDHFLETLVNEWEDEGL